MYFLIFLLAKLQHMICITQNMCLKRQFMLSAGFLANGRPPVAEMWGSQKSCTDSPLGWGQVSPTSRWSKITAAELKCSTGSCLTRGHKMTS